ncbi:hypothetical protein ACEPAH_8081 [Sanghuangporus vaninii]
MSRATLRRSGSASEEYRNFFFRRAEHEKRRFESEQALRVSKERSARRRSMNNGSIIEPYPSMQDWVSDRPATPTLHNMSPPESDTANASLMLFTVPTLESPSSNHLLHDNVMHSIHPSLLHWSGDHSSYASNPSISVTQDTLPGTNLLSEFAMGPLELGFGTGDATAGEAIAWSVSALMQSMDIPW